MAEANELLTLTADIVAAHVSNNSVAVNDLPNLVRQVHDALAQLGQPTAEAPPVRREPKASIRSSVMPDSITCLLCGKKQKTLKRHLMTGHQMTPAEYREEFDLKGDYPMVAPDYAETRRSLAKSIGLGTKRGRGGEARAAASKPRRARKPKGEPSGS
jgi:predicted transcriptional regulator